MDASTLIVPTRRPRFRRAPEPPAFRLTDDVHIVRQLARHRFLRSTHIAALVGRSLDRTNDRLLRLFHAGYIDRPRAQLDYYPTAGSSPIAYALADRGARLLIERDGIEFANVEWSRKNRKAGRPFIEHQLEIVDFTVALQVATGARRDVQFVHPNDIITAFPKETGATRNPLSLRVKLSHTREPYTRSASSPTSSSDFNSRTAHAIPLWSRSTAARCPSPALIFCKRASSGKCAPISRRMPGNSTRSISVGRRFGFSP
jgi:hypothetical protein